MYRLSREKRIFVLKCLTEGMTVRGTVRTTGVAKATVLRLLATAGKVCAHYQDVVLRDLPCKRLQCDEIWSYVYVKQKRLADAAMPPPGAGDVWTWVAMCADTKLIAAWQVGDRTANTAVALMQDLQPRLRYRVQLTTDGHLAYLEAVEGAFGAGVDYAQLVKVYSDRFGGDKREQEQPLPEDTDFIQTRVIEGKPDEEHISTSYVERQNGTMRSFMRRFARRTYGFSKKLENHAAAVALHVMYYNFCWQHSSLRVSPAMEAGVTDHLWDLGDIVTLIEDATPAPGPRGSYIAARAQKAALRGRMMAARARRRRQGRPPVYVLQRAAKRRAAKRTG